MKLPTDWSDVLSPVVVKEIRQGIRAKVFVGAFLITQILMVFSVFLSLMMDGRDADFATVFFWILVSLPLLCIMPARGLQAVGSEIRDETIDLVFLSRLSAWRIVVGKWAALTAQSALLVSSLLPYMVLRYFIGSVNLLEELLVMGIILGCSILLCSGAVGVSSFQPRGKKSGTSIAGLLVLGVLALMILGLGSTFSIRRSMRGGTSAGIFGDTYACIAFLGPMLILFLLQIGASRIAPPAENHAWRKRLTAVLTIVIAIVLSIYDVARPFPFVFASIVLAITVIDAICEPIPKVFSIFLPFAKRGLGGRIVGRFFYPGWASGTLFGMFAVTGLWLWSYLHPEFRGNVSPVSYLATMGIIFWPLAMVRMVRPNVQRPLAAYCAVQAITAVLATVAVILSQAAKNHLLANALSIVPLAYVIVEGNSGRHTESIFLVGGVALMAVAFVGLLWRVRTSFAETDALVAEVLKDHAEAVQRATDADEGTASLPPQSLDAIDVPTEASGAIAPPPLSDKSGESG